MRGSSIPKMERLVRAIGSKEAIGTFMVAIVFLALWEWGPALVGIPDYIIPPVSSVVAEYAYMVERDALWERTWETAFQVFLGFGIGSLLGMVMGYVFGMSRTIEVVLSPYILALQIAPKVAFAPLFIMWFGYSYGPKILVAILIVFFPVMVNVLSALRNVDPDMINLARSFKATRTQIFWKIEFPASMPPLFSGLRIGATLAVIGVVVGEIVGGNIGLGALLMEGEGQANAAKVFLSIVFMTVIGIIAYLAVVLAERRVLHYMPSRSVEGF